MEQDEMEFNHFLNLIELQQIESILEIGVFEGGTLARFCHRFPYATVIGIDPDPKIAEWRSYGDLLLVYGKSQDHRARSKAISLNNSRPFDVIFIDGDHEDSAVREDWNWAKQNARKIVAFHDINSQNNDMIQVRPLWNEICTSHEYKVEEISHVMDAWGIGVVYL